MPLNFHSRSIRNSVLFGISLLISVFALFTPAHASKAYNKADLRINIKAPQTVIQGSQLRYDVHIKNVGPHSAQDIEATLELPRDTLFVESSIGCEDSRGLLICKLGELKDGSSRKITLVLQATEVITTLKLKTRVDSHSIDPKPYNNVATRHVVVQADMPEQPNYLHYTPVAMHSVLDVAPYM